MICSLCFSLISCSELEGGGESSTASDLPTNAVGETIITIGDFTHLLPESLKLNVDQTQNIRQSMEADEGELGYKDLQLFMDKKETIYIVEYEDTNSTEEAVEALAKSFVSASPEKPKIERRKIAGMDVIISSTFNGDYHEVFINFIHNKKAYSFYIASYQQEDIDLMMPYIETLELKKE
jgi:hypothetical protein